MMGNFGQGRYRNGARLAVTALVSCGALLGSVGTGWAQDEPEVPSGTTSMSLLGNRGEEMGSAEVRVSQSFPGTIDIEGWVTDEKGDSRCVYIEYKVVTAFGNDDDDTLVRVCGKGDTDYKSHHKVPLFGERFDAVEFKLCREEGAKFVPDPDTCTSTTLAA